MRGWVCTALLAFTACGGCEAPVPLELDASVSVTTAVSVPVATATSSVGPWTEAAAGDALAALRLAELHTAPELAAIARGGPQADVALAALAHAEDAELALGALVGLVADPSRAEPALRCIDAIASRPMRNGEAFDPDGLRVLLEKLDRLSRDTTTPRSQRVLAIDALRGFARAGYLAPERVTRELD